MSAKTLTATAVAAAVMSLTALRAAFYPTWLSPSAAEPTGQNPARPPVQTQPEYRRALQELRYLLENCRDNAERARYTLDLADGLREIGETESATSLYEAVVNAKYDPARVTGAQLGAARCKLAENRIPEMVKLLDSALPRDDRDRVLIAELQYLAGRTNTAKNLLDEGNFLRSDDLNARLRAGLLYRALRHYKQANDLFASFENCNDDILKAQASQLAKLARAGSPGEFINGVYAGKTVTADGELTLEVTVKNGAISKVEFVGAGNTGKPCVAEQSVAKRMVKYNGVIFDPVNDSEEFCTSAAVAAAKALEQARRNRK